MNGKQVWLARIPPAYIKNSNPLTPDVTRNERIEEYNSRIADIASADAADDTFLGPDFYGIYTNRTDLFADNLHPNDAGYQVMAEAWHDTLIP